MEAILLAVSGGIAGLCALGVMVVCGGCGAGNPVPEHGILFAHSSSLFGGTLSGGGDLYVWQPGARPRRLTNPPNPQDQPAWSPNGKHVAYTMTSCHDEIECWAFFEVYVANSDGGGQRQLTFSTQGEFRSTDPSWSPDGRRLAFVRDYPNYSQLGVASVASAKTRFLPVRGLISQLAWGKAGIAYLERAHNSSTLLTIQIADPNTGSARPFALPSPGYSDQAIAWSKRGQLAALESSLVYNSNAQRVAIYSATGQRIARFQLPKQWTACAIDWSPRGTRLLLTRYRGRHYAPKEKQFNPQLFTVAPSGKHWKRLRPGLTLTSCNASWR